MNKKNLFHLMAIFMVAILSVGFVSCSDDDDDEGIGISESQIREYLESGSGTWSVIEVGDEDGYPETWYFRDGKTNGWGGSNFAMWGTPYTIKGSRLYITDEDADNYRGDVLEGGIIITRLTNSTLEFYWANDKNEKYIGTKL